MTLKEVLNLMDHEVWVRIRVHDAVGKTRDLVLWSADWIGGGIEDPGMPDGLAGVLEWDADDLSVERHPAPDGPEMQIVVNVYNRVQEPFTVYVLEKLANYGAGVGAPKCRVFLDESHAEAAMRDDYDAEIDSRDYDVDKDGSYITSVDATLWFSNGVKIEWVIHARTTEDNDYR